MKDLDSAKKSLKALLKLEARKSESGSSMTLHMVFTETRVGNLKGVLSVAGSGAAMELLDVTTASISTDGVEEAMSFVGAAKAAATSDGAQQLRNHKTKLHFEGPKLHPEQFSRWSGSQWIHHFRHSKGDR